MPKPAPRPGQPFTAPKPRSAPVVEPGVKVVARDAAEGEVLVNSVFEEDPDARVHLWIKGALVATVTWPKALRKVKR